MLRIARERRKISSEKGNKGKPGLSARVKAAEGVKNLKVHTEEPFDKFRAAWWGAKPWGQSRYVHKDGTGSVSRSCYYCQRRAVMEARVAWYDRASEPL